jgi:glycosyltransferase involved in cell wall biosynthesis
VVHAHAPRSAWTLAALFFASRYDVPAVLTPFAFYGSHDLVWRSLKAAYDATLLRYTFRLADRVINLTESDRADAIARGLAAEKSRIIPTSVRPDLLASVPPVDFRAKYDLPWDFLLFVGRFDPVKQVDFLIRAQSRIRSVGLVLIGSDAGSLPGLRRLVSDLGLHDRVRIIERAPLRDLCGAYRQARALVLASRQEGMGIVLLEALFFGCPVVAARVGGVPYVVRDPALGLTYPSGDEDAYAAAVEATLARGRDVQGVGRRLVEREYAWDVNARRVLDLYREIVVARPAAA